MRQKWISFMYGEDPWPQPQTYAFGPAGEVGALRDADLLKRRRIHEIEQLDKIGWVHFQSLVTRLLTAKGTVEEAYVD